MNALPEIKDISRPPRALVDALAKIGTATLSSELERKLGIRDPQIRGPKPLMKGRTIAGPALTLQCMPKREDLYTESDTRIPSGSCTGMCSIRLSRATWSSSTRAAILRAAYSAR